MPSLPTNPISRVDPSEFMETMDTKALFKKYTCSIFWSGSYSTVPVGNVTNSSVSNQCREVGSSDARILFMLSSGTSPYLLGLIQTPQHVHNGFLQSPFQICGS